MRVHEYSFRIVSLDFLVCWFLKKNKRTVVVEPLSFIYTVYSDRVLKKHLDTDIMLMAIYKSIIFSVNNSDSTNMYF